MLTADYEKEIEFGWSDIYETEETPEEINERSTTSILDDLAARSEMRKKFPTTEVTISPISSSLPPIQAYPPMEEQPSASGLIVSRGYGEGLIRARGMLEDGSACGGASNYIDNYISQFAKVPRKRYTPRRATKK